MKNEKYNVNIYYTEDEVHAAFQNHYNEVRYNSVVHVFSKNSAPFEAYRNEENVLLYDSGNFFDKIRNWLAGESQFDDQFDHLRISPENRERYLNIIDNGGTIVISNAAAHTDPTFKADHIASREKFADDFDYPTAAGMATVDLNTQNNYEQNAITDPEDPMFSMVNVDPDLSSSADTNKESYPYEPSEKDVTFTPIEQDLASKERVANDAALAQGDDVGYPTNKESYPYESANLSTQQESRTFGVAENAQPTNLTFNPAQENDDINASPSDALNMASTHSPVTDDIPLTFDDGHKIETPSAEASHQLEDLSEEEHAYFAEADEQQQSTGSLHEHYSQKLEPTDTISTFDTIASRNHSVEHDLSANEQLATDSTESVLQFDDHDETQALDQYENEKTNHQNLNPFALKDEESIAVDDTLHRADGLEDEEVYQEFVEDENYNHLRDETLGKAADYRRHDLP